MAWVLDGNNILGYLSEREGRDPGREGLLERLLAARLPSPLTVVFDGPPPEGRRGLRREPTKASGAIPFAPFSRQRARSSRSAVTTVSPGRASDAITSSAFRLPE